MKFRSARRLWVVGFFLICFTMMAFTYFPQKMLLYHSNDSGEKGFGNSPDLAAYREDKTIYSKQLINDSSFDLASDVSPWNSSLGGYLSDVNGTIENSQCNSSIVGDTRTISILANFSRPGEWTAMQNPQFPTYPQWDTPSWHDSYGNDSAGLWANHTWVSNDAASTSNQRPSINWARNISLPVNISDYEITSVNISSQVNASVDATGTYGLEVQGDSVQGISTGDYARFYVRVSDLARINMYELAYNRTAASLGNDSHSNPDLMTTTSMTSIPEDFLIAYLESALSQDFRNFTIIVGIDFWAENNQPTDRDRWDMMRINSLNLTFTLQKKINYNSYIAWNETGYRINSTDYLAGGESVAVSILNATLNFNYRLTQAWPTASPNSEIRVYINNYLHTETIKLSNGTTSFQFVKGGDGFDVTSLVASDQNVTIRIQIIMLDNFLLNNTCSVLIDNVNLTAYFEATVRTTIPDTQLKLVGSSNIVVPWNDSFTVTANYTVKATGTGIPGANITIGWADTFNVTDLGDGRYNITCNTTVTSANQHYTLQILAEAWGNESQSYSADIQIIGRPTNLYVFLNQQDLTSDPEITVAWNQTVNITTFYYDTGSTSNLTGALVQVSGSDLNPDSYAYSEKGTAYEFLVNSSYYEVGTHFVSLAASLGNYSFASKSIILKVTARPTDLQVFLNELDLTSDPQITVPWNQGVNITAFYYDTGFENNLTGALVEISGTDLNPSSYVYSPKGAGYEFLVNSSYYQIGTHFISLAASFGNYSFVSKSITVRVIARSTYLSIYRGNANVTTAGEMDVPLTGSIMLDLNYTDASILTNIDNYLVSVQGLASQFYTITPSTTTHLVINTTGLELGVYIVSIIAETNNYTQISHSYRIIVNPIPSVLTPVQDSITIEPQQQFTITCTFAIDAAEMGTGGIIPGAEVTYYWSRGEGSLTDNGDGTFSIRLEGPLNPGAYKITITALKANYEVQTIEINIIVKSPETGGLMTIIMGLAAGLVGFAVIFLSYLLYFRYPGVVRKIRKVRGTMKKGGTTKLSTHPKKRIFVERLLKEHGENIPPEARTRLKSQYLQLDKEEPLDRKIPEEFSPKIAVVQELEPAKTSPAEKVVPKPAPKSATKQSTKKFEKPQQVDFGKKPEVRSLPTQKPEKENAKPVEKEDLEENKAPQEEKKPSDQGKDTENSQKE